MEPSTPLSAGTVTFLFTDIEGSTRLWEQHPDAMQTVLAHHDTLLRTAIETHQGRVFKTMGDAFCAAFAAPEDALQAAIAAQHALQNEVPQLRVRMALHTGAAQVRQDDYFGPALNRIARLLAAGHGQQVLLSDAIARQVREALPGRAELRSLGAHRLRYLSERETIYQLLISGLPSDFPSLDTLDVAFRRGVLRATTVLVGVLLVVSVLAVVAVGQARLARRAAAREAQQRRVAQEGQRALRRTLYAADMSLADQAGEAGNLGLARELLEAHRPERDGEELRGFEWRYLWRLTRGDDLFTLRGHTALISGLVFSSDGRLLASGSFDGTVRLWDVARQQQVGTLPLTTGLRCMALSRDGKLLAAGLLNGTLMLWDLPARRLVATRKAHTKLIRAVSFSSDGRLLVTASGDGTLKLWSVPSCRVVADFRSRDPTKIGLDTAVFTPNGKLVAIKTGDGLITLWEVATKRVQTTFQGFVAGWAMTFSPDGTSLAAGDVSGDLRVWDLAAPGGRPRLAADVVAHTGTIFGVAFSPDGKQLATASGDTLVKLWAFAPARARRAAEKAGAARPALQLVDTLRGHTAPAAAVAFSPDGKMLATGGIDSVVRLWEIDRKRKTEILKGPSFWMSAVALSADGRLLAAGNSGRTAGAVRIWELAARGGRPGQPAIFRAHEKEVRALAFSPDGRILATASEDQTVKLWDVSVHPFRGYPREISTLWGHQGGINAVAFSPDGKTLATGGEDRTVRLWDQEQSELPASRVPGGSRRQTAILRGHEAGVSSVAFSPDGRTLTSGSGDGSVRLWRLGMQRGALTLQRVTVHTGHGGAVNCVAFSRDGRLVASGGWEDSTIRLWDVARERALNVLRGHQFSVTAVVFSADGKTLASSSEDFTVKLWNLTTGREVTTLKGHTQALAGLAFSADGNLLVSGSTDGTVRLWRAAAFAETDGRGGARLRHTSR